MERKSRVNEKAHEHPWFLAVLAGLVALGVVAAVNWNPWTPVSDELLEPVGQAAGIVSRDCPRGWERNDLLEEGTVAQRCQGGDWFMIMVPGTPIGIHAYDTQAGGDAIVYIDCAEVPNWPRELCRPSSD